EVHGALAELAPQAQHALRHGLAVVERGAEQRPHLGVHIIRGSERRAERALHEAAGQREKPLALEIRRGGLLVGVVVHGRQCSALAQCVKNYFDTTRYNLATPLFLFGFWRRGGRQIGLAAERLDVLLDLLVRRSVLAAGEGEVAPERLDREVV